MKSDELRKQLEKLHNSAFGWAMVCCARDPDCAVEVLQEAYCRILSSGTSFFGESTFSTWVFGVIRNVAREETRHRRRRKLEAIDAVLDQPNTNESPESDVERRELAERLQAALAKISDRQREVLHLTFYHNMTIEQAAGILEITVGSARQHYQRGKAALRQILIPNQEFNHE